MELTLIPEWNFSAIYLTYLFSGVTIVNKTLKDISLPVKALAFLTIGLAAILVYDQSFYWRKIEDYSFGYFVPLFAIYVIYDRWPKISAYLLGSQRDPNVSSPQPGTGERLLNVLVPLGMVIGLMVFALGGLIRASQGPMYLSSLLLCIGLATYVLGTAYIASESDVNGRTYSLRERLRFSFLFTFPALVWVISGPMVEFFASDLSLFLQGMVANVVYHVFNLLGMPIFLEGSVLVMANGQVGVADACTGIRSLTGCIFAGCFLAAVFLDKLWKKVLLVVMAIVLAVVTNLMRGLFLTGWAYRYGSDAIEGSVHDITGYAVLGLTTVFLLLLLPLFQLKLLPEDDEDEDDTDSGGSGGSHSHPQARSPQSA